jgi:prepilin-type N-terminal cleavage/methylation domain-containing protein
MTGRGEHIRTHGFTLLELMIATAIFVVIGGAALALFAQHQPVFARQQNLAGLNISIRNAVAQLQLDVVNAGNGYYTGANIPDWPVGITIVNSNPGTACNTPATFTYSATCFDQLNIIASDPLTPASHPDNGTFSGNINTDCIATTTSPIYLSTSLGTLAAATALAANFKANDELLLVDAGNSSITTIWLTAAGATYTSGGVSGVKLIFNTTNADGTNTAANDPLSISTNTLNPKLNVNFCADDWVLRLQPITYKVNTATAADPQLVRVQGGTTSILADQVIGFKVGAAAWNVTDDTIPYSYNASAAFTATPPGYNNQFWLIRSVQMSLIARTTPVTDPTYTYRNGFDTGPYQIESVMVVVNPRNMTMNNN